jgi:hypothetical protein
MRFESATVPAAVMPIAWFLFISKQDGNRDLLPAATGQKGWEGVKIGIIQKTCLLRRNPKLSG